MQGRSVVGCFRIGIGGVGHFQCGLKELGLFAHRVWPVLSRGFIGCVGEVRFSIGFIQGEDTETHHILVVGRGLPHDGLRGPVHGVGVSNDLTNFVGSHGGQFGRIVGLELQMPRSDKRMIIGLCRSDNHRAEIYYHRE